MTRLTVAATAEEAARRAAGTIADRIADGRLRGVAVHLLLAGGSTPRRAYELLAGLPLDWHGVHLWLGDERCVPADDARANERMVRESLLARLPAGAGPQLHGACGELGPEDAAWRYGRAVVRALGEQPVFDVALLGLGPDGHTASLFPGHPATLAREAPVVAVRDAPKPPPERITVTLPVLGRARHTLLLATGAEKRAALGRVRAGDVELPPARLGSGLDEIVCDEAAISA